MMRDLVEEMIEELREKDEAKARAAARTEREGRYALAFFGGVAVVMLVATIFLALPVIDGLLTLMANGR